MGLQPVKGNRKLWVVSCAHPERQERRLASRCLSTSAENGVDRHVFDRRCLMSHHRRISREWWKRLQWCFHETLTQLRIQISIDALRRSKNLPRFMIVCRSVTRGTSARQGEMAVVGHVGKIFKKKKLESVLTISGCHTQIATRLR